MTLIVLGSCVVYFTLPFALIAYLFVRKQLKVTYHICRSCRSRRRRKVALAIFGGVGVLVASLVAFDLMQDNAWLILIGFAGAVLGAFAAGYTVTAPLRLCRRDGELALKKLSAEYLDRVAESLESPDEMLQSRTSKQTS